MENANNVIKENCFRSANIPARKASSPYGVTRTLGFLTPEGKPCRISNANKGAKQGNSSLGNAPNHTLPWPRPRPPYMSNTHKMATTTASNNSLTDATKRKAGICKASRKKGNNSVYNARQTGNAKITITEQTFLS